MVSKGKKIVSCILPMDYIAHNEREFSVWLHILPRNDHGLPVDPLKAGKALVYVTLVFDYGDWGKYHQRVGKKVKNMLWRDSALCRIKAEMAIVAYDVTAEAQRRMLEGLSLPDSVHRGPGANEP